MVKNETKNFFYIELETILRDLLTMREKKTKKKKKSIVIIVERRKNSLIFWGDLEHIDSKYKSTYIIIKLKFNSPSLVNQSIYFHMYIRKIKIKLILQ